MEWIIGITLAMLLIWTVNKYHYPKPVKRRSQKQLDWLTRRPIILYISKMILWTGATPL
jgi:hypothetical protein